MSLLEIAFDGSSDDQSIRVMESVRKSWKMDRVNELQCVSRPYVHPFIRVIEDDETIVNT